MSKKESKVVRPGKSSDIPNAPVFDPVTFEPTNTDKRKAVSDWFKTAKNNAASLDGDFSVIIDPKQAAYQKKKRK